MQLHKFLQSPFEAIGYSPSMLKKKLPNLAYKTLNPFFASPVKYRSCRYCHFQESGQNYATTYVSGVTKRKGKLAQTTTKYLGVNIWDGNCFTLVHMGRRPQCGEEQNFMNQRFILIYLTGIARAIEYWTLVVRIWLLVHTRTSVHF